MGAVQGALASLCCLILNLLSLSLIQTVPEYNPRTKMIKTNLDSCELKDLSGTK